MDVAATGASAASANAASAKTSAADKAANKLTTDFGSFLTLLTSQLQHQDPLAPMDSTQFTQQLAQFSQVEQSIATNKNLEQLLSSFKTGQAASAVNYLGKDVIAEGTTNQLRDGQAAWQYKIDGGADRVGVVISNAQGKVVYAGDGSNGTGTNDFVWDGKDNAGNSLPDGAYSAQFTALNATGGQLAVTTYVVGRVDGVRSGDGGPYLQFGNAEVALDKVVQVKDPNETATSTGEVPVSQNPAGQS